MADQEKHVVRMLQRTLELGKSPIGSAPMCIPVTSEESFRSNTGPLIDVIVQRPSQDSSSAPLGSRDKVATPSQVHKGSKKNAVMPEGIGASGFYDKGGRWKKKLGSVIPYIPIMNPHAKVVRYWNQIFALSCLLAIFIDPLFFFLLSMDKDNKCIVFSWHFVKALTGKKCDRFRLFASYHSPRDVFSHKFPQIWFNLSFVTNAWLNLLFTYWSLLSSAYFL